jgi:hypothetical protein
VVVQSGTESAAEAYLQEVRAHLGTALSRDLVHVRVVSGSAATEVLRAVPELGLGLLVMCTHGWRGLTRALLRSTTTRTLEEATVPLMVIGPNAIESMASAAPISAIRFPGITPVGDSRSSDLDCVDEQISSRFLPAMHHRGRAPRSEASVQSCRALGLHSLEEPPWTAPADEASAHTFTISEVLPVLILESVAVRVSNQR